MLAYGKGRKITKRAGGCGGEQMSSSGTVQRYDRKTGWVENRTTIILAHRLLVMRVSSILMPVCGRVTLLPHPSTEACTLVQTALCSAIRPSRLALRFTSLGTDHRHHQHNIIIDRLVLTRAGEPRSTMHPLLFHHTLHSPSMTTSPSNAPC